MTHQTISVSGYNMFIGYNIIHATNINTSKDYKYKEIDEQQWSIIQYLVNQYLHSKCHIDIYNHNNNLYIEFTSDSVCMSCLMEPIN